jgi:hypothetical protein
MPDKHPVAIGGVPLPPGVIQPFFLRLHRDDLHVMAFFDGHPLYEAVEAMIETRADGSHGIRAILTRHDQSQIDHVNDDGLHARMRGAQREIHRRDIGLELHAHGPNRGARLQFTSGAGEQILLEVSTQRPPAPRGAGLSDPGGHSATSSLPLMWRAASALAGPDTRVTVDDLLYRIRPRLRSGAVVGCEGYYTEGHSMGVIRAGTVTARMVASPTRLDTGGEWTLERDGRLVVYRIIERAANGRLRIEARDGPGERIDAFAVGDRLFAQRVTAMAAGGSSERLTLSFDQQQGFAIDLDGAGALISGRVESQGSATSSVISLIPQRPDWAVRRPVRVTCERSEDTWTFTTTIGSADLERLRNAP